MSSSSSPSHSPSFFLLQGCERVERVRSMNKREGESVRVSERAPWCFGVASLRSGQVA
jgi:hypothetical protein